MNKQRQAQGQLKIVPRDSLRLFQEHIHHLRLTLKAICLHLSASHRFNVWLVSLRLSLSFHWFSFLYIFFVFILFLFRLFIGNSFSIALCVSTYFLFIFVQFIPSPLSHSLSLSKSFQNSISFVLSFYLFNFYPFSFFLSLYLSIFFFPLPSFYQSVFLTFFVFLSFPFSFHLPSSLLFAWTFISPNNWLNCITWPSG